MAYKTIIHIAFDQFSCDSKVLTHQAQHTASLQTRERRGVRTSNPQPATEGKSASFKISTPLQNGSIEAQLLFHTAPLNRPRGGPRLPSGMELRLCAPDVAVGNSVLFGNSVLASAKLGFMAAKIWLSNIGVPAKEVSSLGDEHVRVEEVTLGYFLRTRHAGDVRRLFDAMAMCGRHSCRGRRSVPEQLAGLSGPIRQTVFESADGPVLDFDLMACGAELHALVPRANRTLEDDLFEVDIRELQRHAEQFLAVHITWRAEALKERDLWHHSKWERSAYSDLMEEVIAGMVPKFSNLSDLAEDTIETPIGRVGCALLKHFCKGGEIADFRPKSFWTMRDRPPHTWTQ